MLNDIRRRIHERTQVYAVIAFFIADMHILNVILSLIYFIGGKPNTKFEFLTPILGYRGYCLRKTSTDNSLKSQATSLKTLFFKRMMSWCRKIKPRKRPLGLGSLLSSSCERKIV